MSTRVVASAPQLLYAPFLRRFLLAAAILWHLLSIFGPPSQPPPPNSLGRDFASYHYAAKVAWQGGDPYDKAALDSLALQEGTRPEVHPYFYPPPFLILASWSIPVPLGTAFWVWSVLNEIALIAAVLVLAAWWRSYSPDVLPLTAGIVAVMYAVHYSAELGQANMPVLLLAVAGLWQEQRRPLLAGILVGIACMMKMSPAVLVLWWLIRGRFTCVLGAILAALGSSLLVLPMTGLWRQLSFYRDVLPGFGSGEYNGLRIQISMFGNHSLPNIWDQYFPGGGDRLTSTARALSGASAVAVVGGLLALFAKPTEDPVKIAAQGCAMLVGMLLVPVYTYEHHLVFALPAMVLGVIAVVRGWLHPIWALLLGIAIPTLCLELPSLRMLAADLVTVERPGLLFWVQEAKTTSLVVVGCAMVWLGATAISDPSRPPPPAPA